MKTLSIFERIWSWPYRFIFVSFMVVTVATALAPKVVGAMNMGDLSIVALIGLALVAAARDRRTLVVAGMIGLPAIVIRLATSARPDSPAENSAVLFFSALFFIFLVWVILRDIYSGTRVTSEKIFGALCAYLFIGVTFALLYAHIEFRQPGVYAFSVPNQVALDSASSEVGLVPIFIYYSFVTLTTLGYGDITPLTDAARTLAWIEALLGQLYLAVMVAGFVAEHMSRRRRSGGGNPSSDEPGERPG